MPGCPWLRAPPRGPFLSLGPRFPLQSHSPLIIVSAALASHWLCCASLSASAHSHLRAFARSVPHAWTTLPSVICIGHRLTFSSVRCHFPINSLAFLPHCPPTWALPASFPGSFPSVAVTTIRCVFASFCLSPTHCQTISPLKSGISVCFSHSLCP